MASCCDNLTLRAESHSDRIRRRQDIQRPALLHTIQTLLFSKGNITAKAYDPRAVLPIDRSHKVRTEKVILCASSSSGFSQLVRLRTPQLI
jgi:hypothetical protein